MPKGLRSLQFSFGDTSLTHYGGMALFQQFCRKLGLRRLFQRQIPWGRRDNLYHPAELLLCILYGMVAGLKRISDTRILAYNRSFQQLLGLQRFPSDTTLRSFLRSLGPQELEGLLKVHDRLRTRFREYPRARTSATMDFDSTVLPIYGWTIQGAKVGYNPKKPRRPSYHPVVAFDGHSRDTLLGILRPGNTQPITVAQEMFRLCQGKVPRYVHRKRVAVRLRADAGFYDKDFVQLLDEEGVGYCIVARMTHPLQARTAGLRFRTFRRQGHWQVAQTAYQPLHWELSHRFVVVRRPKPPREEEAGQLTLWEFHDFFYHAFVSNLPLKPAAIYRFYADRANAELDIRELKEALPLGKIPTVRFTANAAHFELILLAYDLVNWFRRLCLPGPWQRARLQTLRYELFMLPARLLNVHHRNVLALPSGYPHRQRFFKALAQIRRLRIP
ncbi:MAG: IS1380 family transposase [Acidobacteria bacterium]|nr:IS1380 family transposase [Acidobacteriota bacterium]